MIKLLLIIICTLFICVILKSVKSNMSVFAVISATIIAAFFTCTQLESVLVFINKLSDIAGVESEYINVILKTIGICILGDFTSGLCKDCGENTLAFNAEFICKCSIIVIAIPLYSDLMDMIIKLWKSA